MAIEWTVEGGRPIAPAVLLREWAELVPVLLRVPIGAITAAGVVAGLPWRLSPLESGTRLESGTEQATATPDVWLEVTADVAGRPGQVVVAVDQEIEDDGSAVDGSTYAEVTAYRTQTSAVLALAGAVALVRLSGGELSGPGLGRRYPAAEIPSLLDDLSTGRPGADEAIITSLAHRVGCANLPVSN